MKQVIRVSTLIALLTAGFVPSLWAAEPLALPFAVAATDPHVQFSGRFDLRDKAGPRCSWSACGASLKFEGTDANVKLNEGGKTFWQVAVDGNPGEVLELQKGEHTYQLATGLPGGPHTVELVKATEGFTGVTQVVGFQLSAGAKLLDLPTPKHRIEVIGDSISCGYGNMASRKEEHFSTKTENAYYTYGAIAARTLGADYLCMAYSGKKMWPDNTMPALYDRALTDDASSTWDFSRYTPDVVLINLATNDFGKKIPDEAGWVAAYEAFIARLRTHYPKAEIYCAIGTMMGDWGKNKPLTTLRGYLAKVVADRAAAGDTQVHVLDFGVQDMAKNGIGADWHPSKKTHELMAEKLVATLRKDLGW